jgi:membrane fusion protein
VEQASAAGDGVATISLQSLSAQRGLATQRLSLEQQRAAAERARLAGQIASAMRQLVELDQQIGLQDQLVASARTAVDQAETLIAKGFATRTDLERRRQGWLQAAQARRQLAQNRDALLGQVAQARAELAKLPVDTASAIAQLQANIAQLDMASAQQVGEQGYQVNAPISGRVTAVQTAVGRFADGRVPLLTIVPDGSAMRAELFAPSRAMGFVQPGQDVRVMYDAFPYQRFGSFPGRVEQLSRTVIAPGEVDAPVKIDTPVYRIRVTLPQQAVAAYGANAPLQPGMTLQANIVLERRSFLEWLLEPVMAVRNRT